MSAVHLADDVGAAGRRATVTFLASAASLAIGFLTSLVAARALGPSGQGNLSSIRTVAGIATSLLAMGGPAALYYLASLSVRNVPDLLGNALAYALGIAALGLAAAALFADDLARAQQVVDPDLYLLAAALMPLAFLEYSALNLIRARRRFGLANGAIVAARTAGLIATIVLVVALDLGVGGAIAAFGVVSLLQVVAAAPVARTARGPSFSRRITGRMLSYGLRAQAGQLLRLTTQRFDLLLLSLLVDPRTVGLYAVAQLVAELVLLVPQAVGWIISSSITTGAVGLAFTHRQLRTSSTLALVVVLGLAALAPVIIVVGYGSAFRDAMIPLLILLPGVWMFACAELVAFVLSARNQPGTASWLALLAGVTTIVLAATLIPLWGLEGAAIASCVAYTAWGLSSLAVVARADAVAVRSILIAGPQEVRDTIAAMRARGTGTA